MLDTWMADMVELEASAQACPDRIFPGVGSIGRRGASRLWGLLRNVLDGGCLPPIGRLVGFHPLARTPGQNQGEYQKKQRESFTWALPMLAALVRIRIAVRRAHGG
jgi:hypothetical protein